LKQQSLFVHALKHPSSREEAFARLVSEYKERLYWHIRKIVLDHDDANDVVQNTFIKVHLNIENFKENSTLFTWMYRIATNEALNFITSKAKKMGLQNQEWVEALTDGLEADSYFDGDEAALLLQKEGGETPRKTTDCF
jgi:RNA polymerase sigma-70 factor (ECF subfamily)